MVQRSRASASACNGNSDTVQERSAASSRQHSYLDMRDDQDDDDSDKPDQPPPVEVRRKKSVGFAVPKEASPEIVSYQPRTFDHRSSMLARTAPGAVTMPQLPSQAAYSIDALVAMPPSTAPDPRYDVDQRSRVIVSSLPSTSTTYSTNLTPIIEVPSSQGRESRSSASSMQAQPSRSFIDTENSLSGSDQSKQESQPRLMSHTAAIVASPVAMPLSGAEEEITDSLHYYMQADNPIEPDNERSGENGKEGVEPVLQSHLQAKIHTAEAGPTSEAHASNDSMKDPPQLHTTIPDEPFTFSPLKF